jgi:hypothetical protein
VTRPPTPIPTALMRALSLRSAEVTALNLLGELLEEEAQLRARRAPLLPLVLVVVQLLRVWAGLRR